MNDTANARRREIALKIAAEAYRMPLKASGLWFHDDVRNNFYYASYLFAAAVDPEIAEGMDRTAAKQKAEQVLEEVLRLQNRTPGTALYGHWPLGLDPEPREASPHELPVEIMGSLMAYFCRHYGKELSAGLRVAVHSALGHVYRSGFFRKPVVHYGHHEAKYTAAKLIYGQLFEDADLAEDGRRSLRQTLDYIRTQGMPEYGALPWFWHWVQAFTCALMLTEGGEGEGELRKELEAMLDYLWEQRARQYVGGAFAGPLSRGWPHDVPGDANVLFDYVQFGDFPLPDALPRTEYAGFLYYEAPERIRTLALDRSVPSEEKRLTRKVYPDQPQQPDLHSYTYRTAEYGAGGLWERVEEFDNEQLRWAFSLPVDGSGKANRLYFMHPGQGYREGDPRHQSGRMEVLFDRNTVLALFPVPGTDPHPFALGVLPPGEWLQRPGALYGRSGGVNFAVFVSGPYRVTERERYVEVIVSGMPGGVAVEAAGAEERAAGGWSSLEEFAAYMENRQPRFKAGPGLSAAVEYRTLPGAVLKLEVQEENGAEQQTLRVSRKIDGKEVGFEDYRV